MKGTETEGAVREVRDGVTVRVVVDTGGSDGSTGRRVLSTRRRSGG